MQSLEPKDDVFVNGEADAERNDTMLTPEYGAGDEGVLPRRSSLMKDASRRQQQRKKTVSFSSMPNEKTVVNGRCRPTHICLRSRCQYFPNHPPNPTGHPSRPCPLNYMSSGGFMLEP